MMCDHVMFFPKMDLCFSEDSAFDCVRKYKPVQILRKKWISDLCFSEDSAFDCEKIFARSNPTQFVSCTTYQEMGNFCYPKLQNK